jgi:hypothetical protein
MGLWEHRAGLEEKGMTIKRAILYMLAAPIFFWAWPILLVFQVFGEEDNDYLIGFAAIGFNIIWIAVLVYLSYSWTVGSAG